jgi:TrmH family RNA methyltransferase
LCARREAVPSRDDAAVGKGEESMAGQAGEQALIRRYRSARRDRALAVLEGFHALKHALRFGAEVTDAVAADPAQLSVLAAELAPDVAAALRERTAPVSAEVLAELVPQAPRTGVVAIARRPEVDVAAVLAAPAPEPLVLLEDPRTMGNMGACVRVAAAADAAGVLTTGPNDPWHPDALRGAAGLHFALPVASVSPLSRIAAQRGHRGSSDRPLVAIDPGGEDLRPAELPPRAILAFGTERYGLSDALLARADARLGIPMRAGVSSLNLATAVAAVLFSRRWA